MGLFERLFGERTSDTAGDQYAIQWIGLESIDQLDEIEQRSHQKPQLIYKHSTSCGVSSMVLNMFSTSWAYEEDRADLYFLDLHRYRPVSNAVADKFEVRHESPQLIVLKEGEVVAHSSHGAITELDLDPYL